MYVLKIVVSPFVLFLLVIVLSVLRYTDSDYPVSITASVSDFFLNFYIAFVYNFYLDTNRYFPNTLYSPGTQVSSTNKTDRHNITEILLKVSLTP